MIRKFCPIFWTRRAGAARPNTEATPHRSPGNGAARAYERAGMTSPYRIERDRGSKESRQQFAVLRKQWPLAFPAKGQDVRPLAIGATGEIAAAMGWSLP